MTIELDFYCDLTWDDLPGDGAIIRRCDRCEKNVYNLTNMSRTRARMLLEGEEKVCVHFVTEDGHIVHEGDPLTQLRRQKRGAKKLLVGALVVQAGFLAMTSAHNSHPLIGLTAGIVKTFGETVETKHTMGQQALGSEVEF